MERQQRKPKQNAIHPSLSHTEKKIHHLSFIEHPSRQLALSLRFSSIVRMETISSCGWLGLNPFRASHIKRMIDWGLKVARCAEKIEASPHNLGFNQITLCCCCWQIVESSSSSSQLGILWKGKGWIQGTNNQSISQSITGNGMQEEKRVSLEPRRKPFSFDTLYAMAGC